jgi:hypothetical protein
MWKQLSDPAREQFFWQQPGIAYQDHIPASSPADSDTASKEPACDISETSSPVSASPVSAMSVPTGGRDSTGTIVPPPPTFLLMLLEPERVKYLRLRDNYAQVDEYVTDSEISDHGVDSKRWSSRRVNP